MATIEGNKSNVPSSSPSAIAANSREKYWSDRIDKFSSSLEANNDFCEDDGSQFFVIKRSEGDFPKTSPFLIGKAIQSVVSNAKSI